jgi:hypothetical protein
MKFACNVKLSTYRLLIKRGLTIEKIRNKDFSEADFSEADFSRADFSRADFSRANFWRADFSEANFSRADFWRANFWRADFNSTIGNGKNIITIQTPIWNIVIYSNRMQIGCENHSILEWMRFTDDVISGMNSKALEFWKIYKPIIKNQIKAINKLKRSKK